MIDFLSKSFGAGNHFKFAAMMNNITVARNTTQITPRPKIQYCDPIKLFRFKMSIIKTANDKIPRIFKILLRLFQNLFIIDVESSSDFIVK